MRRLVNIIYAALTEGADDDALDEFDKDIARDPSLGPRHKSRGVKELMNIMGGMGQRSNKQGGRR